ncbi:RNA polymerase sigma factor RpoE [hydrothermal vent metagenome]|uniref:RNA polymerase sigma factor RpoE n=1 Tax=hydrothermal vent metagenome TaxID=652676 RepID=A0A3B1AJV7_9ZZZZ
MTDELIEQYLTVTQDIGDADKLVRENIAWMLLLAERMLGEYSLAEDAVQDAFISAFRAFTAFEGRSSVKTWLHRITVNSCLMKMRRLKQRAELSIDSNLPEFDQGNCRIEASWDHLTSVEDVLANEFLSTLVKKNINDLPEQYRNVLILRDIEGYNTNEVAKLLGISDSNAKVRLHRARAALKKLLEPLLRGVIQQ